MNKTKNIKPILKRILSIFIAAGLLAAVMAGCGNSLVKAVTLSFEEQLLELENVVSVEEIEQTDAFFKEKYIVTFSQPIDHDNPELGSFQQRVEIGYNGADAVNEFFVSGYLLDDEYFQINDAMELTRRYNGNMIRPEYRYFGQSCPEGLSADDTELYQYLTDDNACDDFHDIISSLSGILTGNFVFTGASKGGQATNVYAYYYPDDCEAFVSYVGPFCSSDADTAMYYSLFNTVGNDCYGEEQAQIYRDMLLELQLEALENREVLQERYYEMGLSGGSIYRDYCTKEILFDLCVAEFAVSFWQYGGNFDDLEAILSMAEGDERLDKIFDLLVEMNAPSTWSVNSGYFSYYIQARRENGEHIISFANIRNAIEKTGSDARLYVTEEMEPSLLYDVLLTDEQKEAFSFDGTLRNELISWAQETDSHVIMMFGSVDPWFFEALPLADNDSIHAYTVVGGDHMSSISKLEEAEQNEAFGLLDGWLLNGTRSGLDEK